MGRQKVGLLRVWTKGFSSLFKRVCLKGKVSVEAFKYGYVGAACACSGMSEGFPVGRATQFVLFYCDVNSGYQQD